MKKVVYISGKMSGLPDNNFPEFNRVERLLLDKGYDVINPTRIGEDYWTWEQFMKADIVEMMKADIVAVLPNWIDSRGAKLEVYVAEQLGIKVTDYQELLYSEPL